MKSLPCFKILARFFVAFVFLWAAGLSYFFYKVCSYEKQASEAFNLQADGIVVLTGTYQRIITGFELLENNAGQRLLISGVRPGIVLGQLTAPSPYKAQGIEDRIDLGYAAKDTYLNAAETSQWMQHHNFHSIILITSDYHMLRSLIEFKQEMPDIEIIPRPIHRLTPENHSKIPTKTSTLLKEYHKTLLAIGRWFVFKFSTFSQYFFSKS